MRRLTKEMHKNNKDTKKTGILSGKIPALLPPIHFSINVEAWRCLLLIKKPYTK